MSTSVSTIFLQVNLKFDYIPSTSNHWNNVREFKNNMLTYLATFKAP